MRNGAIDCLTDADLNFSPGGENLRLGQLIVELGEIQFGYIVSLETLKHDWSYKNSEEGLATSVNQLQVWFAALDVRMKTVLNTLSDADLGKEIDRSNGIFRTVEEQLEIYCETMLIFLGKLVIYFKAMEKPLPPSIQHYIAWAYTSAWPDHFL